MTLPVADIAGTGKRTLLVGLTGGIASGKSTVARLMRELGCIVTDADRLVAELYQPGREGAQAVRDLFGAEFLAPDGSVDKPALARVVFSDTEQRSRLEAAIHPLVGKAFAGLVADSEGVVVFEATLLAETGGFRNYDIVVTVEADPAERIRRAVARGLDRAEAEARMKAQALPAQRMSVADYVIHNDGSEEDLAEKVERLVEDLRGRVASDGVVRG